MRAHAGLGRSTRAAFAAATAFACLIGACVGTGRDGRIDTEWSRACVRFAGRSWDARVSVAPTGAGPSRWSADADAIRVDEDGLHLTLARRGGRVRAVELSTDLPDGPFRAEVDVGPSPAGRDRDVVAAIFVYRNDRNEADVELSRWGIASNRNAQLVLAPFTRRGNLRRFDLPPGPSEHRFEWRARRLAIRSSAAGVPIESHVFRGPRVPSPRGHRLHVNLWARPGSALPRPVHWLIRAVRIEALRR